LVDELASAVIRHLVHEVLRNSLDGAGFANLVRVMEDAYLTPLLTRQVEEINRRIREKTPDVKQEWKKACDSLPDLIERRWSPQPASGFTAEQWSALKTLARIGAVNHCRHLLGRVRDEFEFELAPSPWSAQNGCFDGQWASVAKATPDIPAQEPDTVTIAGTSPYPDWAQTGGQDWNRNPAPGFELPPEKGCRLEFRVRFKFYDGMWPLIRCAAVHVNRVLKEEIPAEALAAEVRYSCGPLVGPLQERLENHFRGRPVPAPPGDPGPPKRPPKRAPTVD